MRKICIIYCALVLISSSPLLCSSGVKTVHMGYEAVASFCEGIKLSKNAPPVFSKFLRVITYGEDSLLPITPADYNSHLYKHYSNRWVGKFDYLRPAGSSVKRSSDLRRNLVSHKDSMFESFHAELSGKITKLDLPTDKLLDYPRYVFEHMDFWKYREGHRLGFLNGHQIILHGETVFPLFGVSIYDKKLAERELKDNKKPKKQTWILPLEQALLLTDLDSYLSSLAILNWKSQYGTPTNYDAMALAYIHKGVKVIASVGITAPQWSSSDIDVPKSFYRRQYSSQFNMRLGGSTQIHLVGASDMRWIQLNNAIDPKSGELSVSRALSELDILEDEHDIFSDFAKLWTEMCRV